MLASWFRILWGDGLPVQALIMDTRLPNIEHGGAGGRTPKRLALFLCFPNFASHVRTHRTTSFFCRLYPIWSPGLSLLDHPHAHFLPILLSPKINETAMLLYGIRTCCSRWPASPGFFAFEDEMGKACWTRRNLDTWLGHSLGGEKLPK